MVLPHIALYHFYRLYSMLFYSCASLKDSHTFAWCEKWKQWTWMGNHWLMTTTVPSCPSHLELCPSVQILWRKLYQLYTSATPPVFSWSAKVHVEWNVRTLKLINLHLCMTGQTYFIVTHCMNWIPFFASLLAFDCLIIEFSISSSDFLSQECMGVKSNRYLIYYEKTTHYESDL